MVWDALSASDAAELTELKELTVSPATCVDAVAKLCADGVREAVEVAAGCATAGTVAGVARTAGVGVAGAVRTAAADVRVACGILIRELTGPPSLSDLRAANDLPPLAVGVLCVVCEGDAVAGAAEVPGVDAVVLISEPVCDVSCCSVAVGTVPALVVTVVVVGSTETA